MDGADNKMSLMKRIASPRLVWFAYSAKYTPAATPIGAPIAVPNAQISTLPKIAFASPPDSSPGGGVISVNSERLIAAAPLPSVVHKIQPSQNKPKSAAAAESVSTTALITLRLR